MCFFVFSLCFSVFSHCAVSTLVKCFIHLLKSLIKVFHLVKHPISWIEFYFSCITVYFSQSWGPGSLHASVSSSAGSTCKFIVTLFTAWCPFNWSASWNNNCCRILTAKAQWCILELFLKCLSYETINYLSHANTVKIVIMTVSMRAAVLLCRRTARRSKWILPTTRLLIVNSASNHRYALSPECESSNIESRKLLISATVRPLTEVRYHIPIRQQGFLCCKYMLISYSIK